MTIYDLALIVGILGLGVSIYCCAVAAWLLWRNW